MMSPGSPAPDVAFLKALRGKPVVVFFYPKDETTICTREACAFRDTHAQFEKASAAVVGVSADPEPSHQAFARHHRLPYRLLSDPDGALAKAFGVPKVLGLLPGRATFVIDRDGIVRLAYSAPFRAADHPRKALEALR